MKLLSAEKLRELLERIPRVEIAFQPTPLQILVRLSDALGGPRIWMKRDDMTGLAFGGNKARKLEFILGDALEKGADVIVTSAAAQSNMLRQTCAAARQYGLDIPPCDARYRQRDRTGQSAAGLPVRKCHNFHPHQRSLFTTECRYNEQDRRGPGSAREKTVRDRHALPIRSARDAGLRAGPRRSCTSSLRLLGLHPTIICPTGSGTTQAGLLLGLGLLGASYRGNRHERAAARRRNATTNRQGKCRRRLICWAFPSH